MTIDLKTLKAMSDGAMIMAAQAEQMAIFAAGMVEGARQMAESMQSIVNDCARQLAERRAAENGAENDAENSSAVEATQIACDNAASETTANVSSLNAPSLPQNAASGVFQPKSGQTGRPDAESRPAPSQGAVGASIAPQTPAAEQTAPQTPPLDLVTLRAFVAERSTPENRAKIKAILTRYGVRKLTELKESQYEAVRNEVAAL